MPTHDAPNAPGLDKQKIAPSADQATLQSTARRSMFSDASDIIIYGGTFIERSTIYFDSRDRTRRNISRSGHILLSFDGGDMLGGLSSLLILRKILYRVKARHNLTEVPLACNIFNLAGGLGTGGLIVILLFRLNLSIEFAVKIYPEVFSILSGLGEGSDGPDENVSDDLDSEASESSFEDADSTRDSWKAAILADRMLKKCGAHIPSCDTPAQVPMFDQDGKSKGFVCASHESSRAFPVIFRTWKPQKNQTHNCTIFEALLATCSRTGVAITNQYGIKSTFVSVDLPWNNPLLSVWQEGRTEFGTDKISCVVSIGAGPESGRAEKMSNLSGVLLDIGKYQQFSLEGLDDITYVRFNAGKGPFDVATPEFDTVELLQHHAMSYLERDDVNERVDQLVDLLQPSSSMKTDKHKFSQ